MHSKSFFVALLIAGASVASAQLISKDPDIGNWWYPLSSGGTYVYADSFVAPSNAVVTSQGCHRALDRFVFRTAALRLRGEARFLQA